MSTDSLAGITATTAGGHYSRSMCDKHPVHLGYNVGEHECSKYRMLDGTIQQVHCTGMTQTLPAESCKKIVKQYCLHMKCKCVRCGGSIFELLFSLFVTLPEYLSLLTGPGLNQ